MMMTEKPDNKKAQLMYKARIAEQCDRSEDLLSTMKAVVELGEPLNVDDRNLFSLAFKSVVSMLRNSYRTIQSIEQKLDIKDASKKETIELYREKIQAEMDDLCKDAVKMIDTFLLPKISDDDYDATVFLLKMKADYFRYLAELLGKLPDAKESIQKCQELYKQAYELAVEKLTPTNPMRLGVALNYSVFFYEIAGDAATATQIAKNAFDEGIVDLDGLQGDGQKEAIIILQLIRDNLALWQTTQGSGVFGDDENMAADDDNEDPSTKIGGTEEGTVELIMTETETVVETKTKTTTTVETKLELVVPSEEPVKKEHATVEDVKPSQPAAVEGVTKSIQPVGDESSMPEKMDDQ